MDALTFSLLIPLFVIIVAFFIFRYGNSKSRLPPGPPGKPLVGNLFDVDTNRIQESFMSLGKDFDDIFSLKLGSDSVVVVKSIQAYRELHQQDDMAGKVAGRPTNFVSVYASESMDIVLPNDSPGFRKRRNICRAAVWHFEESQEKIMREELGHIVDRLGEKIGEPQELDKPFLKYLTNLCLYLLIDRRLDYDDPMMHKILERNVSCMQQLIRPQVSSILSKLPWLRHIPFGYGKTFQRLLQLSRDQQEVIYKQEKLSFDPHKLRGMVDAMLKHRQSADEETDSWLSDDHIWRSAQSVIGASTIAPAGLLLFFPPIILRQPEVGLRIQKEIDKVIGRNRLPTLADRDSMPYTEAFVLELLRYVAPVPTLVPRLTVEDVEFREYLIPKGTTIMTNVWEIFHDEKLWEEPWTFRPERFLDESGRLLPPTSEQRRNLVPFGGGSRVCLGSSLFVSEAFLFISAILQRFDFQATPDGIPDSDPRHHILTSVPVWPHPYKIILKERA